MPDGANENRGLRVNVWRAAGWATCHAVKRERDGSLHLIAGGHRLEAARRLGWEEIEAKVWTDVTDDWARLMEVDDNLAGSGMNALDTAVFLATRKAVYERLHPETKAGVAGGLARQGSASELSSFADVTAEKFNMNKELTPVDPVQPVAPWLGGKRNLAKRICTIIDHTPCTTYAEPFVGMGGIFLRRSSRPRGEVTSFQSVRCAVIPPI